MNRMLLSIGGLLTFLLALFKIAMPNIFHWREAMETSAASMWSTLYAENLGISLLLLFFAYMSIFQWQELLVTGSGRTVMLSICVLWTYRVAAEVLLYKIGVDGEWWRVFLFLAMAVIYLVPLITMLRANPELLKPSLPVEPQTEGKGDRYES